MIRDGEDLHPKLSRAIRLCEHVAVGLHAVGKDDRATEIAGRGETVGELHRARDVGRGAKACPLGAASRAPTPTLRWHTVLRLRSSHHLSKQIVPLELRRFLRVFRYRDHARALGERNDSYDSVFG